MLIYTSYFQSGKESVSTEGYKILTLTGTEIEMNKALDFLQTKS